MDLSMRGGEPSPADIGTGQVAAAGGSSLEEIRASRERSKITDITIAGAIKLARDLPCQGKIDGVVAIGGSTGSLMATEVMRALPFGRPQTDYFFHGRPAGAVHPLHRHRRHRAVSFRDRNFRRIGSA